MQEARSTKKYAPCKNNFHHPVDATACIVHYPAMKVSEIISAKRAELGLNQREFAELVGVNVSTVWRWEEGKVEPLTPVLSYIASLRRPEAVT